MVLNNYNNKWNAVKWVVRGCIKTISFYFELKLVAEIPELFYPSQLYFLLKSTYTNFWQKRMCNWSAIDKVYFVRHFLSSIFVKHIWYSVFCPGIFCPVYYVRYNLSSISCPCIFHLGIFCLGTFCLVYFAWYILSGYVLSSIYCSRIFCPVIFRLIYFIEVYSISSQITNTCIALINLSIIYNRYILYDD